MSSSLFNCLSPQTAVGSGSICLYTDLVTIESWTSVSGGGQAVEVVQVRGSIRGLKWGKEIRKREYWEGQWEWGKGAGSSETQSVLYRQKCNLHLLVMYSYYTSKQQRGSRTCTNQFICYFVTMFCYFCMLYLNLKLSLHTLCCSTGTSQENSSCAQSSISWLRLALNTHNNKADIQNACQCMSHVTHWLHCYIFGNKDSLPMRTRKTKSMHLVCSFSLIRKIFSCLNKNIISIKSVQSFTRHKQLELQLILLINTALDSSDTTDR